MIALKEVKLDYSELNIRERRRLNPKIFRNIVKIGGSV